MSSADILRTPGLAQALVDGANALDQNVRDAATIAGLQTSLTAAAAQHAADVAEIAQLEAELHPQPPAPTTLWGMDATSKAQHDDALAIFGPQPLAWRYYLQPGEALHMPTEYSLRPGDTWIISSGLKPQDLTVPQLATFFGQFPTDRDSYFCIRHEPEPKIKAGSFTSAQLKAGWHTARLAQQQVGNPHIKLVVILEGYTWQKGSKRNPEDFIPADADFDYLTTDTYFAGSIGQAVSTIPTAFDPQIATAKAHGKPWGITETGIGPKVTGQARLDAIKLLAQTIKAKGAFVGCWFQNNSTTAEWALNSTTAQAWKASQTG